MNNPNDYSVPLMSEVKGIIDEAAEAMTIARATESKSVLLTVVQKMKEDNMLPTGQQVLLLLLGQKPIKEVDAQEAHRPPAAEGKTVEQLEAEGYTGGAISMPYTFDNYDDAIENLESKVGSLLADHSQGQQAWASISCHKEQGTTTYIMVASACVTLHKVLPTGDSVTQHYDPVTGAETTDVQDNLYKAGKRIAKAQYAFTCQPQLMRKQYPDTYQVMLNKALKIVGEGNNEQ
jgi:hypothetical protein